jgi:hypothetical protein
MTSVADAIELEPLSALVNSKGRLQFSEDQRRALDMWLLTQIGNFIDVALTPAGSSLTEQQRRWYFGQILGGITRATGQPKDDLHVYFKSRLLGNPESKLIVLVDRNGEVKDERDVLVDTSITVLSRRKMRDYCDDIRTIAAEELHVVIADPDPTKRTIVKGFQSRAASAEA